MDSDREGEMERERERISRDNGAEGWKEERRYGGYGGGEEKTFTAEQELGYAELI